MQHKTRLSRLRAQAGFSLIEVLVAVVVLSIGILGIAGLQARVVQQNTQTYARTQATILAQNMADRMRANVPGASAGDYDKINLEDTDFDPAMPIVVDGKNKPQEQDSCFNKPCNQQDLATWDQFSWLAELKDPQNIPTGGTGCVTCDSTANTECYAPSTNPCHVVNPALGSCRVTVLWQQNNPTHQRADANGVVEHCVEIGFQL